MSNAEMRMFETTLFKDKNPPTDNSQIPAAGAGVNIAKQGATVTGNAAISEQEVVSVPVSNTGRLEAGDSVQKNVDNSAILTIVSVGADGKSLTVTNPNGPQVVLVPGDRLFHTGPSTLAWYQDGAGALPGTPGFFTLDGRGYRRIYCRETRMDMIAGGIGPPSPVLFIDEPGGFVRGGVAWVNARDFPTLQKAVDAVSISGGIVYIPAGTYDSTTTPSYAGTLLLPADRPITVRGDGPGQTILKATFAGDMLNIRGDTQSVDDMTLIGKNDSSIAQKGIVIKKGTGGIIFRVAVRRVDMSGLTSYGLYIDNSGTNFAVFGTYEWVNIDYIDVATPFLNPLPSQGAVYIAGGTAATTAQYFNNCRFVHFWGTGVQLVNASGIAFRDCVIETQQVFPPSVPDEAAAYVFADNCNYLTFDHCWFESSSPSPDPDKVPAPPISAGVFIFLTSSTTPNQYRGILIANCNFIRGGTSTFVRAVRVEQSARSVCIVNPDLTSAFRPLLTGYTLNKANIYVADPSGAAAPSEVEIIGGSLNVEDAKIVPLMIKGSARTMVTGRPVSVEAMNQSSAIALTKLLPEVIKDAGGNLVSTGSGPSLFRISAYARRRAGSSGIMTLFIQWDDGNGLTPPDPGPYRQLLAVDLSTGNQPQYGEALVFVGADTFASSIFRNIKYTTTMTGTGTRNYDLRIRVELLSGGVAT